MGRVTKGHRYIGRGDLRAAHAEQAPGEQISAQHDQDATDGAGSAHGPQRAAQERKGEGDRVGIERLVAVAQGEIERAFAGQDALGLGAIRGFVVRHPRRSGIQLGEAQKSGHGQENDEHADLDPGTRPPGMSVPRRPLRRRRR
jgi:hypothetical protein